MSFDQGGTVPTYHYRCKNCGYDFTEQQSFEDDPITVCPQCGQEQVRKVYSAVPIEFKGHGFYRRLPAASARPAHVRHAQDVDNCRAFDHIFVTACASEQRSVTMLAW